MQGEKNVALVTGSSSGIGFETAILLARSGFHTYASMRNLEKSKDITQITSKEKLPLQVVQLDVNDDTFVKEAIEKILILMERLTPYLYASSILFQQSSEDNTLLLFPCF